MRCYSGFEEAIKKLPVAGATQKVHAEVVVAAPAGQRRVEEADDQMGGYQEEKPYR